ncbi:alkaline phosphatase D family protein [Marinigracilibium pacificum]|uniref:Alkaline phosphatase D family protein n=1 Tax=Marinigracilibium pacificum TaxID=2729599 RepID=A0A848ISI7_9BACT|nr:alkaline phosphatase D family protein [Marinigracilibium pacificum]NMM47307.1 alkaline phosphatase D family protein [Marinigracilibium pacificum]
MKNSNKDILSSLSRRKFLRNTVMATAGLAIAPSVLIGCKDEEDPFDPDGEYGFFEGVASFDPEIDRVILWSRYTPASNESNPQIVLEVSKNENFNNLVVSQPVQIDSASDNTLYVDLTNLDSNTTYFYRFSSVSTKAVSKTGITKTLPEPGEVNQVKIAVVSCANYQAGLFNTYGAVSNSDADIVVHLGDYIYEYGKGGYGSNELTALLGRYHSPQGEIISVDDYRQRYRQYRQDKQLQELHRTKPFICVWDDHEIANDAYKDGAQNHQPNEGDYNTRKLNAIQVWHEYLPARVSDNAKIYRNFNIAGIIDLIMLDTRIAGRDKQLDYTDYFSATGFDQVSFGQDWQDQNRTILGNEQLNWVTTKLSGSTAKWQVLGSQVLMGKYYIPAELLVITAQIAGGSGSQEILQKYTQTVTELVTIKSRMAMGDPTVTPEEKARVETVLPYNLDAWDGYPVEREKVFAAASAKNLISIAGDTHNAWYSKLSDFNGNEVGKEMATASVSSPGFEGIFGNDPQVIAGFELANTILIDDLIYADASRRGYMLITFDAGSASADWRFIRTLATEDTSTTSGNSIQI